jgi:transcriptional regulator NrdR family protein
MDCPTCTSETEVIETRSAPEVTRRRRRCIVCGQTFSTLELAREEITTLQAAARFLEQIQQIDLAAGLEAMEGIVEVLRAAADGGQATRPAGLDGAIDFALPD